MSLRTIMIFPDFENMATIDSIRKRFDPLADLVRPHITIVFPFESDMSNEELSAVLDERLKGASSFDIALQDFGNYSDASGNYLSLYLTKGAEEIVKIHDALYSNEFKEFDPGFEYVPHITVGKLASEKEMEDAFESIRTIGEPFVTTVKKISVEMIGEHEESIIIIEKELSSGQKKRKLEKMGAFFDARTEGYEEHQMTTIDSAEEFYPFTADQLPKSSGSFVLDLGCGTGLELDHYFVMVPTAHVTGIDLSSGMLQALSEKYPDKQLDLICASYFEEPFGVDRFDAVLSVESLHHFTKEEKIPLYTKVKRSLKENGYFILTDYFASSEEEEKYLRAELIRLKKEQNIGDDEFYHYDTPLTVAHEKEALLEAGFTHVDVLRNWGHTYTLKAY